MILADKVKTLDDKIEANETQHHLDKEEAKIYHLVNWKSINIWLAKI